MNNNFDIDNEWQRGMRDKILVQKFYKNMRLRGGMSVSIKGDWPISSRKSLLLIPWSNQEENMGWYLPSRKKLSDGHKKPTIHIQVLLWRPILAQCRAMSVMDGWYIAKQISCFIVSHPKVTDLLIAI
ncbi:MAG: hypothetical protein H7839_19310 [Magnetococcus sp. YQC-5]